MKKKLSYKIKTGEIIKIVSLTVVLSFIFFANMAYSSAVSSHSETYSTLQQVNDKIVTIKMLNVPIKDVLYSIQQQSGISFAYDDKELATLNNTTVNLQKVSVKNALDEIFKDTPFTYRIIDKGISIYKKEIPKNQIFDLSGKVLDENKNPIVGATVIILGTANGAITDDNGDFKIKVTLNDEIEFSSVGFVSQKRTIKDSKNLVISLNSDIMSVDDIVVTGIFNKPRESYTGSMTAISEKEIKMYRGQNLLSTLRNIDPALNIVQNNLMGSNPNILPEVNIRGNSSLPSSMKDLNEGAQAQLNAPLVIMDGFEISLQRLMDFNDEDVASINIMKDASATALYGSRGANGVIVVTTKTPKAGKLRLFVQGGLNIEMPDLSSYDLLNPTEKLDLEKSVKIYSHQNMNWSKDAATVQYNEIYRDILSGVNTYWLSKPLRTSIGQRYNARLEGGNSEFRWGVSLGYNGTLGVMKDSDRGVLNGAINLAYSYKNFIFRNQTTISYTKSNESPYGSFSEYVKMNPYWRTHDQNGELIDTYENRSKTIALETSNPLYNATLAHKDYNKNTEFINNFAIEWNIIESLKVVAKLGISKGFNTGDKFMSPRHTSFSEYGVSDFFRKGTYKYDTGEDFSYDGSVTVSYSKLFAEKHQLYAGLDFSLSESDSYNYTFRNEGYGNENFNFLPNAMGYQKDGKSEGSESISRRVGFTGNINYTYCNRYFADFLYRVDGGSQFGSDRRFAPFWSAGLGWNLHNEKFLQGNRTVSMLRLKGSYGISGSQQFDSFKAKSTYRYNVVERYMFWNSAYLIGFGNDQLKWQTTNQANIGVEVGLFQGRLNASVDIYDKTTDDLLSELDLPLASGFPNYVENVGKVQNRGFEASLSGYLIRDTKRNLIWSLTAKMAYNKNEIAKLSDAIKTQNTAYHNQNVEMNRLLYEGYSQNAIYVVRSLGIDPSTGEELFLDKDGNTTYAWNPNAKVYGGVSEPKYRGNISTMVSYKGLSLNLSFGYHFGGQQYNQTIINRVEISVEEAYHNADRRVLEERWMKPGDIVRFNGFYKADGRLANKTRSSSRLVENDNVFSLQSANLEYRLDNDFVREKLKMQAMTLAFNMSDVFYVSTIKRERGLSYPFSRRASITLSLTF